nr:MAG TPA: hypothetical protein [Caudoviricetes sp.]
MKQRGVRIKPSAPFCLHKFLYAQKVNRDLPWLTSSLGNIATSIFRLKRSRPSVWA